MKWHEFYQFAIWLDMFNSINFVVRFRKKNGEQRMLFGKIFDKIIASNFIAPVGWIWKSETEKQDFHDCCSPSVDTTDLIDARGHLTPFPSPPSGDGKGVGGLG
jgi:hypothetical protein